MWYEECPLGNRYNIFPMDSIADIYSDYFVQNKDTFENVYFDEGGTHFVWDVDSGTREIEIKPTLIQIPNFDLTNDYYMQITWKNNSWGNSPSLVNRIYMGICQSNSATMRYGIRIDSPPQSTIPGIRIHCGSTSPVATVPLTHTVNVWHTTRFSREGSLCKVYQDNTLISSFAYNSSGHDSIGTKKPTLMVQFPAIGASGSEIWLKDFWQVSHNHTYSCKGNSYFDYIQYQSQNLTGGSGAQDGKLYNSGSHIDNFASMGRI